MQILVTCAKLRSLVLDRFDSGWVMTEGRSAFLSLTLSPPSKRAVNRIIRLMPVRAKASGREREKEREPSALFESNWVNVKQYNTRVIMDSGVNLVPYAASTNIGWDKRRPFGFLYGAKARRCNATTNSPDRLQCFPREVVRKFVISPGDFHDSSTRLSATTLSNA